MSTFFKYLKLLALGKDVAKAYREEKGKDKPALVSRRFYGSVVALMGYGLLVLFNVALDTGMVESFVDNSTIAAEAISKLIPAAMAMYGQVIIVIGQVKRGQ